MIKRDEEEKVEIEKRKQYQKRIIIILIGVEGEEGGQIGGDDERINWRK